MSDRSEIFSEAQLDALLKLWGETRETSVSSLTGNCMSPVLHEGDRLVLRHGDGDLHPGDVVVVRSSGGYLVQRVIRIDGREDDGGLTVAGDRLDEFHPSIPRRDVVGKVVGVRIPGGVARLDTRAWRWMGRLLALRAYCTLRSGEAGTPWWRTVAALRAIRSRVLPLRFSITLLPMQAVCRFHRAWNRRPARGGGAVKEA
jgi:hypothetical protein